MKPKKMSLNKDSFNRKKKNSEKMPIKKSSKKRFSVISKSKSSSNFGDIKAKEKVTVIKKFFLMCV